MAMPYVTEAGVVERSRYDVALAIDRQTHTVWLDFAAMTMSAMYRITALCYRNVEYPNWQHIGTSLVILLADELALGEHKIAHTVTLHDEGGTLKVSMHYDPMQTAESVIIDAVRNYLNQVLRFVVSEVAYM